MRIVEHFLGRCACGSVYDAALPEYADNCAAWEARHTKAGHAFTTETYENRVGMSDPAPEEGSDE